MSDRPPRTEAETEIDTWFIDELCKIQMESQKQRDALWRVYRQKLVALDKPKQGGSDE